MKAPPSLFQIRSVSREHNANQRLAELFINEKVVGGSESYLAKFEKRFDFQNLISFLFKFLIKCLILFETCTRVCVDNPISLFC